MAAIPKPRSRGSDQEARIGTCGLPVLMLLDNDRDGQTLAIVLAGGRQPCSNV
jgi:hypothetical protein